MMSSSSSSDSDRTISSDELRSIIAAERLKKKNPHGLKKSSNSKARKVLSNRSQKLHELSDSNSESDGDKELFPAKSQVSETNETVASLPFCKYGAKCYRKNPEHFKAFSHERSNEETSEKSSAATSKTSQAKKQKVQSTVESQSSGSEGRPFNFFFTTVHGIPEKYNSGIAQGIKDLLSPSRGKLKASAQFNYMFDISWLMEQYPAEFRNCPLTIVHGEQREAKRALENTAVKYSNIKFCQAKLDIPFGTHHTKMMFLLYEEGLRIVIHTSNIVDSDWYQRTQGMWVSPLFSLLEGGPSSTEGDSITRFKADMIEYVCAYQAKDLDEWCMELKKHDMSEAKVFLIGSVPGRHIGSKKTAFGHLKLRKVLNQNGPASDFVTSNWPVIGQFSSIGSLGASPNQWMCGEWLTSLATAKGNNLMMKFAPLMLVYPSVENVRKSLEGYPAGASLPYSIKVASKQPYMKDFFHEWKSERAGRSKASPHIKTYLRVSPDCNKIAWLLITSANLSKAAWGVLEKKESQLMIRSYELGVLFLPEYFGKKFFSVKSSSDDADSIPFPIPFDIPLSRYNASDEPWIWDIPHVYAPDRHGKKWCPP